jgi:signal transduction histidine kinase
MGNFYKEGQSEKFLDVCRNHTHVMPTEAFGALEDAHARLREIALLQQRANALRSEIEQRRVLEGALRDALRERQRIEEDLCASVVAEREARARAEQSDAFKEVFLGMLGHDLRNPLNTILMTARLMLLQGDVSAESAKRLTRLEVSGLRMKRMIEQILDMTRARHGAGIIVEPSFRDVVPHVSKVVEELRAANPGRAIELTSRGACEGVVDGDRIEQVVSNLVSNALVHGDPTETIRVTIEGRESAVSIGVHNHGPVISPAVLSTVFDPFARSNRSTGKSDGLGLGLYISERIVAAHGGTIEVESSSEAGTRFEVILPRAMRPWTHRRPDASR